MGKKEIKAKVKKIPEHQRYANKSVPSKDLTTKASF
jgi:hypothetical protein